MTSSDHERAMSTPSALSKTVGALLKLGFAGATIVAIAALFVVMHPDGSVQETRADIIDLEMLAPQTSTQKFVAALDDLGHEKPRIYNYNGTQLYFSTRMTTKRPDELIDEYQRVFVERGVNSKPWGVDLDRELLKSPSELEKRVDARRKAAIQGEVQLSYHDPSRMIMNGALLRGDRVQFVHDDEAQGYTINNFHKLFKMHRYIEAEWNPVQQRTVVTATWSDEDFDVTKTLPEAFQDHDAPSTHNAPDLDIPACIGCTRLTRFATEANDKPYVKQVFSAPSSRPDDIAQFYKEAMPRQGWRPLPGQSVEQRVADKHTDFQYSKFLSFQRNGQFATIAVHPDEYGSGSMISTMITD